MKKCRQKIENMPLKTSSIFSRPWQMSQSACFPSKIFCAVTFLFWSETACVSKARGWPQGWQIPGPRAAQNLSMSHPRDWHGGQMPRSSRGGGGLGAGRSWNWLMHKEEILCFLSTLQPGKGYKRRSISLKVGKIWTTTKIVKSASGDARRLYWV